MEHFRGVSVPLTFDDFEARLGGENVGGYEAGDMLWEAGIIGLCISPKTEKAKNDIKSRLGDDCRYEFSSLQGKLLKTPYFLFEYNCSDEKIEKMKQKIAADLGYELVECRLELYGRKLKK